MRVRLVVLLLGVMTAAVAAQTPAAGLTWGGFQVQGAAGVSLRFSDVRGYRPGFLEFYDLRSGPRMEELQFSGTAPAGSHLFADSFSFNANGWGGDPFPTAQFTVRKQGVYDFRANWRQTYFYFDRNDAFILPGTTAGLTSNHNFATVRKLGSADLTLYATNGLRLRVEFSHAGRDGDEFAPQSPDFFNSPSYWGTFARGYPYLLFEPLQEDANRIAAGFDYTLGGFTLHYLAGYQTLNQTLGGNNVSSPEFSINTAQATNGQAPLVSFASSQSRRLHSPVSEFSYTGELTPELEYRGDYLFYRYAGPARLVEAFNGTAPGSAANTFVPYAASDSGETEVSEPQHIVDQGLSYQVRPWWNVDFNYRLQNFASHGEGQFRSLLNGVTAAAGSEVQDWKNEFQSADVAMAFTPWTSLVVRPGLHLMRSDIREFEDGVLQAPTSLLARTAAPEISVGYTPGQRFSLRGDVHSYDTGASYTAISPHTRVGGHVQARGDLGAGFTLGNDFSTDTAKLQLTGFVSRVRMNTTTLTYALEPHLSFFGGFTYDSEFAAGQILYARGTPPLNDTLRDQAVNRVVQGGLEAGPFAHFGVRLSGNYDRTTGTNQISGEPASDGPLTWPLITGTVFADAGPAGRLAANLQRTYYLERVLTGNNFSANMLTLTWTRSF
ncbi:MAG: hypothetical protein ACTHJX_10675 [Terriglobales bacterium]